MVSLHCPLTPDTREMVNRQRLATMKRNALLINTARGGLIDEQDLADALNDGRIAGAALDVLSAEPPARRQSVIDRKELFNHAAHRLGGWSRGGG